MPLPAVALLDPSCPIKPAWALFDSIWYSKKYARYLPDDLARAPQSLLAFYLQSGCRAGHSPSALFDEQFYLSRNPDIAILVEAGHYRSGFDHFCQYGHRALSPHWLFDDAHYADLHDDMTLENLDLHRFHGRYDHYLTNGQHEHRSAHLLFDSRFYRAKAIAAGDDPGAIDAQGCFSHYLGRLQTDSAELPPSIYFDPAWYIAQHENLRAEIEEAGISSALEHYLTRNEHDPVSEFSEKFYRDSNPDVRRLIASGQFRNGYHHFLQLGAFELRSPSPDIDLAYYRDANSRVADALNSGQVRDAFAHLRGTGLRIGLSASPSGPRSALSEPAAKQLFIRKAMTNLALFARRKLDFSAAAPPDLSVIMVLFEKFELTMLSLCALRDNYAGAIELIIIDNASTDDSPRIGEVVIGAKITLLPQNIGYSRAANLGLQQVTTPQLLLLNNDVELGHGAIAAAIARLQSDPRIGAVGGKIIRTHGSLQEAGSIIWKDGTVSGYMRDAAALAPEANFVRDVDFCSGVFLFCSTSLIQQLGGFDPDFSPAYYEDVDLCRRIWVAGYRVIYDPAVVIHHLEYGSAANSEASKALMQRGRQIFLRKHENHLQTKRENTPQNAIFARSADTARSRILVIEDTIPLRRLGSGYVRSNDIVRAIAAGHSVSVFPLNGAPYDIMSIYGDFPDHVEILHDRDFNALAELLEARSGYYDCIWISRTHNLNRVLPILLASGIDPEETPLILDTEAIASLRDAARAALDAAPFDLDAKLREAFAAAARCRHLIAVNQAEADQLRRLAFPAISILGTMREPQPTPSSFAAREGLLLVAAIHQPDSPNLDALNWYADAILPALALEMRQVPLLTVAGYIGPEIDLSRYAAHPHIKIHGPAADLRPFYDRNRLFIAPARFAAGTPYKLYETAAYGLPAVATDLLAGQLQWQNGVELLTAPACDAKSFAARIAQLYRSETIWQELRANALARIAKDNTPAHFNATVATILNSVKVQR
jgi:GT2 family glycosyltransferase/glycosyltransferase involved in cell wall biosynthesis